jgi:hypothetical protein
MRFAVVAHRATETNIELACAEIPGVRSLLLTPSEAVRVLEPGDVALARLDIRPGLDGVERGYRKLHVLAERGVRVLNPPSALLAAHDKLITASRLRRFALPHPRTRYVPPGGLSGMEPPVVVKPRFGSWGRDVIRCDTRRTLHCELSRLVSRSWFRVHGAIARSWCRRSATTCASSSRRARWSAR